MLHTSMHELWRFLFYSYTTASLLYYNIGGFPEVLHWFGVEMMLDKFVFAFIMVYNKYQLCARGNQVELQKLPRLMEGTLSRSHSIYYEGAEQFCARFTEQTWRAKNVED